MAREPRFWQSLPALPTKQTIVKSVALSGAAAVLATLTLLIGGMVKHELSSSLPSADAQPAPSTTTTAPSTAAGRTTQSARTYRSDARGFLNSSARCSDSQVAVALGRTEKSLVVICEYKNAYQYRGVRQRDGATLTLPAKPTASGGFVAENDGVSYAVTPDQLLVTSDESVIARESMIEYHQPQSFAEGYSPGSASGSYPAEAAPSATATSTPASPSPETPRLVEPGN